MNIYVSNLAFSMKDEDLKAVFEPFGTIDSAKIIKERESGRSRGFGFVEMPNDDEARSAIDQLNGKSIDGREIKVTEARPKDR